MTLCALILGAGFTPALPSTMEQSRPAPISFTTASRPVERSTAPDAEADEPDAAPAVPAFALVVAFPDGHRTGAVAGRAPPALPA